MTTALAIAAVTAVLRDLLNDGLIQHNAVGVLGSSVSVGVGPPDRVVPTNGSEASQLNLFLYQVTPNIGWRNEGLPSRDSTGRRRLANPPLALNLHYLVSAYSAGDFHGEILLGYAMQLLHENPVLSRQAIRTALHPSPDVGGQLPAALRALASSGLEDQIEQIKITPEFLNTEEMSKLWTATQTHLRLTAAYMASVVLIEAGEPAHTALPVLTVGHVIKPDPAEPSTWYARGVAVQSGVIPALPTIEAAEPADAEPAARMGGSVDLRGHHLNAMSGTDRTVLLVNDKFRVRLSIVAQATAPADAEGLISFVIPETSSSDCPVGIYAVSAEIQRPGETGMRETNRLGLTLAPTIIGLPLSAACDTAGTATFRLHVSPAVRPGQRVRLVLGQQEFAAEPLTATSETLTFVINQAPMGSHLARIRVDGIESNIVDRSANTPVFLNQRIAIT